MANFDLGALPSGLRRRKSQSTAQIYIDELMEEYTCPICFDEMKKSLMTRCGHNFCGECIRECLDRKHSCPICTTKATNDELIRNHHLDSVLAKLVAARKYASQQIVDNLMKDTIQQQNTKYTSPISKIFTKYTSETLVKYENYYQQMLREFNKTQMKLQEKLKSDLCEMIKPLNSAVLRMKTSEMKKEGNEKKEESPIEPGAVAHGAVHNECYELFIAILYIEGSDSSFFENLKKSTVSFAEFVNKNANALGLLNPSDVNEITVNLQLFCNKLELSHSRMQKSCKLLFDSFEEYMQSTGPSPFLLPVSVTIRLRGRSQFWELRLNPSDRIGVAIDIVRAKFADLGDSISKFSFESNDDIKSNESTNANVILIGILRPLADRDPQKPLDIVTDLEVCISELNIRQGTQIHILTKFVLKSEAPRPCFTYKYNKDLSKKCDYMRCQTCGLNWICQACSIQCHKGHELCSFMKNHQPSYACCYCVKKKKCKIKNCKTKEN